MLYVTNGFLSGTAVAFSWIGAQSFLLMSGDPLAILAISAISSFAATILMDRFLKSRSRFSHKVTMTCGTLFIAAFLLALLPLPNLVLGLLWFGMGNLAKYSLRFMMVESVNRTMSASRARVVGTRVIAAHELGVAAVSALLWIQPGEISPHLMMIATGAGFALICVLNHVSFSSPRKLEFRPFFNSHDVVESDKNRSETQLVRMFMLMVLFMGFIKYSEEYLLRFVLHESSFSFEQISKTIAACYLLGSVLATVLSACLPFLFRHLKISLFTLYVGYVIAAASALSYSVVFHTVVSYAILEVVVRSMERSALATADHILFNVGSEDLKLRLRRVHQLSFYTFSSGFIALVGYALTRNFEISVVLSTQIFMGICCLFSLFLVMATRSSLLKAASHSLSSEIKNARRKAIETLSHLRPRRYLGKISPFIKVGEKVTVRKAAIGALMREKSSPYAKEILGRFARENEEIQFEILEAIEVNQSYAHLHFLWQIILGKTDVTSSRIRSRAVSIISKEYGAKAIPVLLEDLKTDDPRELADAIEVLGWFREPFLVETFRSYLGATDPRVRANAIIALSKFPKYRPECIQIVKDSMDEEDPSMLASLVYVVSSLRVRDLVPLLHELIISPVAKEPVVERGLAAALTNLGEGLGYKMFAKLIVREARSKMTQIVDAGPDSLLNLFASLDKLKKLDVMDQVAEEIKRRKMDPSLVFRRFKLSGISVHEELYYLSNLLEKYQNQRRLDELRAQQEQAEEGQEARTPAGGSAEAS